MSVTRRLLTTLQDLQNQQPAPEPARFLQRIAEKLAHTEEKSSETNLLSLTEQLDAVLASLPVQETIEIRQSVRALLLKHAIVTTASQRLQLAMAERMLHLDGEKLTFVNNVYFQLMQLKPQDAALKLDTDKLFHKAANLYITSHFPDTAAVINETQRMLRFLTEIDAIKEMAKRLESYSMPELEHEFGSDFISKITNNPAPKVVQQVSYWQSSPAFYSPKSPDTASGVRCPSLLSTDSDSDEENDLPANTGGYVSSDDGEQIKPVNPFSYHP